MKTSRAALTPGTAPESLRVLGIMSGTSIDSVDYALCSVTATQVQLHSFWRRNFPDRLRERLHQAARGFSGAHETAQLHHDLGRFFARQALSGVRRRRLDLVGLHGQTIFHNPGKGPATFQIGEPAYLAELLRVPVVSNFRAADLAAGGQGAPLATLFHQIAFGRRESHVCVNNLGGISNVTSIDWRRSATPNIQAFDTGPANVLMDLAVRHFSHGTLRFDKNGTWARRGVVAEGLLTNWLRHPYLLRKPPKSTGREMFGEIFLEPALKQMRKRKLNRFDALATLTEYTARTLVLNYRLHLDSLPDKVILAGGGAANPSLVERIRRQLLLWNARIGLVCSEGLGWPVQSIEPAAFALLAYYRLIGKPANIPSTTGAKRSALLGQISEP